MSTVLLLQPQAALGSRLQILIESVPGFEVVGCVEEAEALRPAAQLVDPDLVIADLDVLGSGVARTLRQLREGRYNRPKVLVIAMSADDPRLLSALRDGADGWFAPGGSRSLPACMQQVLRGEAMLSKSMARAVQEHFDSRSWDDSDFIAESRNPLRLSGTDRILLQWTIDGHDTASLARATQMSEHDVGVRLRGVLRTLQFDLSADALTYQTGAGGAVSRKL